MSNNPEESNEKVTLFSPGKASSESRVQARSPVAEGSLLQKPTAIRYLVLVLACGISFILYLQRYAWGFIKEDLQKEFGWNNVDLGWLDGLFALSYGLTQIPSGVLCDKFGARILLGASIIAWSGSLFVITVASNISLMAFARLMFGSAQASCYPVLNKVSANWFPLSMRTTAQAWIATFFGRAGGAMSFFLIGTVLLGWLHLPWREAIIILSLLGACWGVLFLFLFRNTPREHPWANRAEAELVTAGDPEAIYGSNTYLHWGPMLRSLSFWLLLLRAFASNLADVVFVYWMPLYLTQMKGFSRADAGWIAALPLVGGALGGLTSGLLQSWLIRSTGNRRLARNTLGFGGKLLAAGLMLTALRLEGGLAIACAFLAVKFFTDMEQPAEWGAVSDIAGRNAATVFSCVNCVGALGGFAAGPLTGWVLHSSLQNGIPTAAGWEMVFTIIAAEYLVSAACWVFIDSRKVIG